MRIEDRAILIRDNSVTNHDQNISLHVLQIILFELRALPAAETGVQILYSFYFLVLSLWSASSFQVFSQIYHSDCRSGLKKFDFVEVLFCYQKGKKKEIIRK